MIEFLAGADGVMPVLLAARADYYQVRPYLLKHTANLPIHYLPSAERLIRVALIATRLVNVEHWSGAVDWVYSPKEQPVATARARLAVTIHDVLAFEPHVPGLNRRRMPLTILRWRLLIRQLLQRAALIVTVSEFTRRRIIELFSIRDEERLLVVGNGIANCYFALRQSSDNDTLVKVGLRRDEYLMTVGSLTYRKGGDLILEFAQRAQEKKLPWRFVVTGRRHDPELFERYNAMRRSNPDLPLELPGYVSDKEQAILVRNALAMVFPSRYEGFGIPVPEAMAAGTPVICSRAGALPEVAGDGALLIDSTDRVDEWLNAVGEVAKSSQLRNTLIEKGRRRAAQFTWEESGSRLLRAMIERS
jgi:glycosyltransferase involved in cell wall biosynthesis